MPARLESTPRAFGPKFQTLSDAMESLSGKLQDDRDLIKGMIYLFGLILDYRVCEWQL